MRKIPTVFLRDMSTQPPALTQDVHPDCLWVLAGEGVAMRKYDGTCVMFDGARWWARREVKPDASEPDNFVLVDTDEVTGKKQGWEPIEQSGYAKAHAQALLSVARMSETGDAWEIEYLPGTYELCGPKINRNPEGYETHRLIRHADAEMLRELQPRTFDTLRELICSLPWEGLVFHHPDGRMAKLKARDFEGRAMTAETLPAEKVEALAEVLEQAIEAMPHARRLYPDFYAEEVATESLAPLIAGWLAEAVASYENAITWGVTCFNCARLLDQSYGEYSKGYE